MEVSVGLKVLLKNLFIFTNTMFFLIQDFDWNDSKTLEIWARNLLYLKIH